MVLGHPTHREQPCIPGLAEQVLELAYGSDITTWRGSVHSLVEAEDMALDFLPGDVLPGRYQGLAILCVGSWPLTHHGTFQGTGPMSAYPGHDPWPWLLQSSFFSSILWLAPTPGSDRLSERRWRFRRSQFPWLASAGRCYPPGFSAVHTGQCVRLPAPSPVPCWLQRLSLLRWVPLTMA